MCMTWNFHFLIHSNMLSIKNLLSIYHHIETEQEPIGPSQDRTPHTHTPAPHTTHTHTHHVLCLLFVYRKTLSKNKFNHKSEKKQK